MYHKESVGLNEAFELHIQVNVDTSQLEDVFRQTELLFCVGLWFAEETESNISNDKLQLLTSRQKRIQMSPTRGLCHQFNIIFDFSYLCAVEFVIQSYLTNILPGLYRSPPLSNNLHSLIAYERHAKQNWRDLILGSSPTTENKCHFAVATHRHLCQALLSSRERMLIFWHEIAIFLENQFRPSSEVSDLRGLLDRITSNFQQLKTETEMAKQVAKDVGELAAENSRTFRQLCEFIHSTPNVFRHIQRKSHQIRMKRLAEAFFVQELQIPQLLTVYDPASIGHEAMALAVRRSAYFQHLPDLPVSCRQFDGDASNIPIIFEDVYVPLTDAQRNGTVQSTTEDTIPGTVTTPVRYSLDDGCIHTGLNHLPGSCPRSLLSGPVSLTEDPAIADLLICSSSLSHRSLVLHRGQYFVLQDQRRRRSRLNLGRLYKTVVRSEVAGVGCSSKVGNGGGSSDVKLLGYRRIVDDSMECVEMREVSPVLNGQTNEAEEEEEDRSLGTAARKSISLLSLPSAENSKIPVLRRKRQLQLQQSQPCTSRHIEHAISTPNLGPTGLSSSPAPWKAVAAATDAVVIERCSRCGLPDLTTITTTINAASTLMTSVSLPSLSSLDPANGTPFVLESSSLSDYAGVQFCGGCVSSRPTMRRLKQQRRHKAIFTRRPNSRKNLALSTHIYTEDLVNFSSLSDLFIHSCHCDKTNPLTRSHRKPHSASPELCTTATSCITDFNRSRREASNPLTLPSLSEDLRDHEIGPEEDKASPRRHDLHETVGEFSVAVATTSSPLQPEGEWGRRNEEMNIADTTDGPTAVAHWVMRNPDKGIALVQDKITRRSLSQTFIMMNGEEEKKLSKQQSTEQSRPVTSANSTDCLTNVVASSTLFVGGDRLVNAFAPGTMTFVVLKEHLKQHVLLPPTFKGHIYSDFSQLPVPFPYFSNPTVRSSSVHLVICVHGLEGNCLDLRLLTMYLQLALPDHPLEFLMSDSNHEDTFGSLEQLRDNLVQEILEHIHSMPEKPTHISFIGHSLGCVLVRAALSSPQMAHLYPMLHTFLSFCGPHLGTLYSTSGLVSMGMWALQKLKKSRSLLQLRLRDNPDPRETFMYALSAGEGFDRFRYVLLVASPQDHYVPHHSSRIELCRAALQDPSEIGIVYMEMVANILQRMIKSGRTTVVRYDVHYEAQSSANHFIGRAAHIAVLDSDVFMEKFFCVSAAKYFRCDDSENGSGSGEPGTDDPSASSLSLTFDATPLQKEADVLTHIPPN
ncbi:protein FAM135A [Echinococcus multilocularis]|uniref:Protein FAM135A n=1 Tax=Echinococcus multilocularis TaxID=6211 RepID=A0A068YAI0_ECHMU|nr:protein FAM135A [Echinococcus multilocularis]